MPLDELHREVAIIALGPLRSMGLLWAAAMP
jgi:hypothetical protein